MKYVRYFVVVLAFGMVASISVNAIANSKKINNQIEINVDNVTSEVESIMDTKENELFYDEELSEEGDQVYANKNGDHYYYNDNGEFLGYTCSMEELEAKTVQAETLAARSAQPAKEDIEMAAQRYMESIAEDASYYQLESIDYDEYVCVYTVLYTHRIDGVNTNDIVYLGIDNELNLILFSIPRPYAFRGIEDLKADREKIKDEALDIFSKEFQEKLLELEATDITIGINDSGMPEYQVRVESKYMMDGETMESLDYVYVPIG